MTDSRGIRPHRAQRPPEESKALLIKAIQDGHTIKDALSVIRRSRSWYEKARATDQQFRVDVDRIRQGVADNYEAERTEVPDFPEFSERFLGQRVFPHMQNVVDLIDGKEPSWVHPAMTYERGEPELVIVNMPPAHAKSTTVTQNYVTWRIAKDPNIRVIIVSKTQAMATKFLYGIKTRLTSSRYRDFHTRFGPPAGYSANAEQWTQKLIYISSDARDSGEKDPTVQAIGIRNQIYGARADLIILDDCVDLSNAHEADKQIDWIQNEVLSRVSSSGAVLVVGTRLSPFDMYLQLRDPKRYPDESSPWTYLAMPAVLESADDPKDWVTLWPKSNEPEPGAKGYMAEPDEDGLYWKWGGTQLNKKRAHMSPRNWAIVYQQEAIGGDSIFDPKAVSGCINGNRMTGLIPKGMANCRPKGMEGLIMVAGMDPATAGFTAAICVGFDPANHKRYVLDVYNKAGNRPDETRELIKAWTAKYNIVEWRIEKNAFQSFLTEDREVNQFLSSRGSLLRPHFTGSNKMDPDFGVASLSSLFNGWQDGHNMIELPSTAITEAAKTLVQQLVSWQPGMSKKIKTDMVMALWFAELACRDRVVAMSNYNHHAKNPFLSTYDMNQRHVVSLLDAEANGLLRPVGFR